jgi:outer membrane lipoprotein SlyB
MPFVYYGQGVSQFYQDFIERLMSELALNGTEITNTRIGTEKAEMDVKYIDENGKMSIIVDGENVKVIYDVQREREEVRRGLGGALAGAGIGSLMRGVLSGGDLKDRIIDAASGAIAGGTYEAFEGYEDSKEERTIFAQELAEAVKQVEDDLQYIAQGQEAAREALREKAREKIEEDQELMDELEEIFVEAISLKEEIELLELEGSDVRKSKIRVERAETLYHEAKEAMKDRDYSMVRAKMRASNNMIEKARELLDY